MSVRERGCLPPGRPGGRSPKGRWRGPRRVPPGWLPPPGGKPGGARPGCSTWTTRCTTPPARRLPGTSRAHDALHPASSWGQTRRGRPLRRRYWQRYGATLLGLVRHHGVKAAHFLHQTHRLPGLEQRLRGHPHDLAALAGCRAQVHPDQRAARPTRCACWRRWACGHLFDGVFSVEDMPCSATCGPSPMRACCAAWRPGCACRRALRAGGGHAGTPEGRAPRGHGHGLDAALDPPGCPAAAHARARTPAYVDRKLHAASCAALP
jgi:hypothetical protein